MFIRVPYFLTAHRRIAQGKYATLLTLVRMNAGISKLCTRSLKGYVVQCSLNRCCFGVLKISLELRESKENPPFTFCMFNPACSPLFDSIFNGEKKLIDLLRNKYLREKSQDIF